MHASFGTSFGHHQTGFSGSINPALTPVGAMLYTQAAAQQAPVFQQQPFANPAYGQQHQHFPTTLPQSPPTYDTVMQPNQPNPIMLQPGAVQQQQQEKWMQLPEIPAADPNCPFGLQFLLNLDSVHVRQKMELLEVVTNIEVPNRYSIQNNTGEQIYYAIESDAFLTQQMLGSKRNFHFKVVDNLNRHIFTVRRDHFECCTSDCAVEAPPGQQAGTIASSFACCKSKVAIADESGKTVFTIDGPCYCKGACCCQDKEFPVMSGASQIGSIVRKYPGYMQNTYSRADNFEVKFPLDLAVRMKAVMIGTAIFLDFLEFESKNQPQHRQRHGMHGAHGMHGMHNHHRHF